MSGPPISGPQSSTSPIDLTPIPGQPTAPGQSNFMMGLGEQSPLIPTPLMSQEGRENYINEQLLPYQSQVQPQQPQQERKGVFADMYNSLASGSAALGEMIAGLPEFLYDVAAVPQNLLADMVENNAGPGSADWLRASYSEYENMGPLRAITKTKDYYANLSDEFKDEVTKFDNNIVQSIGNGNFGDAGRQVANAITESVPSIVAMVASGGTATGLGAGQAGMMAASALPFASGEYQDVVDNPNIPETAKPVVAGLKGIAEVIFEQGFGTGKLIRDIATKEMGEAATKQFLTGYMERALASNGIPASVAKGSISEASTTMAQNLVERYSGENPDKDVWEGVPDAIVVGSIMDGTIATPSQVSRSIAARSDRRQATQLSEANNEILADLSNPDVNLTPDQRQVLMERYNQNTEAIDSYITQAEQSRAKLTPRQREIQQQMINRTVALDEVMNNEALSDLTRQEAEAELELAQNRLDRQVEVDEAIVEFQQNNPNVEVDYMEDLPDSVVNTFTRVEEGLPVDPVAVEETSKWMYDKYRELTRLKEDPSRRLTIEQIEGIQNQLGEDIATLENYKLEQYEQAEGETVRPETEASVSPNTEGQTETVQETVEQIETPEATEVVTEETITEEPQTQEETQDALEVESTDAVDVRQQTGDGETVVERDAESEIVTGEIEQVEQQEVQESEGEVNEVTEATQSETPVEPAAKKPKKAPSLKELLSSSEARKSRANELRDRMAKYRSEQGGLGIAAGDGKKKAAYWRDVTDYAAIRIVDGAIATARQLAKELGIAETRELNKAFNEAKRIVAEDTELNMTTARNADTARKRAELGFDERIPVITQSNSETESNAREMLEQGYDVEALIEEAMNGKIINATETSVLTQYIAAQEAKILNTGNDIEAAKNMSAQGFQSLVDARNRAMDRLNRAYDAMEASGTEAGRAIQIRKANAYRDLSLANMLADMRIAKGKVKLTESEADNIQKKYKQMSDLAAKIRERNEQLEDENAKLNALLQTERIKNDIEKAKRRTADRKSKPTRKEAVEAADKRLQEVLIPEFKKAFKEAFASNRFASVPEVEMSAKAKFRKAAYELIKGYIERVLASGGKVYVEDIVDRLHAEIATIKPDITRGQVMNLIDATNDDTRASKSELTSQLRMFRAEVRLMNEIARLEGGGELREKVRRTRSGDVIRLDELRKRLKFLRDNIRKMADPADTTKPIKERSDDYDFEKRSKSLEKRIADYQKKLREKDFSPERKELVLDDPRLKDMRQELGDLQYRYKVEVKKEELNRRGWVEKYLLDGLQEVVSIPRTLLATGDMSALFRQMMFTVASRPILTAKAATKMFQFWGSKKAYDQFFADYKASEAYQLATKSGLALTDLADNVSATAREEMFMSSLVNKVEPYVPIFGGGAKIGGVTVPGLNLHKRAERSFTGSINKMRIDLFSRGVELLMDKQMYPDTHKKEYKDLARYVNAATGRGPMPESVRGSGQALSAILFAPRLITSRLHLLFLGPLINTNPVVRKMYARDLISFIGFGIMALSAASLMGADVDDDPTSTDFGMIRVGDTRYDIWGGMSQYVRLIARYLSGKVTSSTGRVKELNSDDFGAMTRNDLLMRFGRSKLSPVASFVVSAQEGKNYMGEPFEWLKELKNMSHPLIIQDTYEAWDKYNEGPMALLTTGAPAFFGLGVQTWRANEFLNEGVDKKLIDLATEKKVATMMPEENRIKFTDLETGEDRNPNSEEFKRYLSIWSDYIKKDMTDNYDTYKKMSPEKFSDEFDNIKSRASTFAKEQISGVSTYDKTFTSDGKTYKLTPEQLRKRVEYNEEYMKDNDWRVYTIADNLEVKGMTRDMALIEARKRLKTMARAYSKKLIEDEFEGKLVEKE